MASAISLASVGMVVDDVEDKLTSLEEASSRRENAVVPRTEAIGCKYCKEREGLGVNISSTYQAREQSAQTAWMRIWKASRK